MVDLGTLEHISARKLWEKEPYHFTPWLADNIDLLGAAIGLDLEHQDTEKPVGQFSCDLVARDNNRDRKVIIENQLEKTDHSHLGQLITYAAGLDAAVIIWISTEFREEHRQALDWLNRVTDERFEFFGLALEAVRVDGSKPAIQFRPMAFPNAWSKKASGAVSGVVSPKGLRYQEFYQGVMDELRETHKFTNARAAQPQNWYAFSSGHSGITYNMAFANGDRMRAEVYIDAGSAGVNEAIFDFLYERCDQIEAKIGGSLEWQRLDKKRACRISLVCPNTVIENAETRGAEMQTWLVDALLRMKDAFGPLLADAKRWDLTP